MKRKVMSTVFVFGLAATSLSAFSERHGRLHVTKECSAYFGQAGEHCTITSSNLPALPPGSRVYYDQAFGIPAGNLDSNVLLYASSGNWAVGRCTLDGNTFVGLCTFSDGVGDFAGFNARVEVSPIGGVDFRWDGKYSFDASERH